MTQKAQHKWLLQIPVLRLFPKFAKALTKKFTISDAARFAARFKDSLVYDG